MTPLSLVAGRSCGECAACCSVLEVTELAKPAHTLCRFGGGPCAAYDARPPSCRTFRCLWLEGAVPGDENRPDRVGLLLHLREGPVILAVECWAGAAGTPEGRALLAACARTHATTLYTREGLCPTKN